MPSPVNPKVAGGTGSAPQQYVKQRAAGGKPRITDAQKRRYFRLIREGWPVAKAAESCGFSASAATKLNREFKPQIQKMAEHPEPRPYDDLSPIGRRGVDDVRFFALHFLGLEIPEWQELLIAELLEAYESADDEYLVVNVHPGSGKSTAVTYVFTTWFGVRERALGREPRVMLGHASESKAKWYLARIAKTLTTNLDLIETYGRFRPERRGPGIPWSSVELLIEPLDWGAKAQKEPTFSVASYEGTILSARYDLIIWDDLLDKSNQSSADQREKMIDTWERDFEGRLDPGGLMVLSNARIGPEDLSHHLLSQRSDDPETEDRPEYRRIIFPAHDETRCTVEPDGKVSHHGNYPIGCILNSRRLAKDGDDARAWRRLQHFMRNENRFRLVWQQEDVDPSGSLAERVHFTGGVDTKGRLVAGCFDATRGFRTLPAREDHPTGSVITVDPSAANYWAVIHFVLFPERHFVFQGCRRRLQAPELIYRENDGSYTGVIVEYAAAAANAGVPVRHIVVEERGFTKWLAQYPFVREWAAAHGIAMIPHDTNRVNKHDPALGVEMLGPVYRDANVSIPYAGYEERLFAEVWAREATTWPDGTTSDVVMDHWFLVHRLAQLQILSDDDNERDYDDDVPEWARQTLHGENMPAWITAAS